VALFALFVLVYDGFELHRPSSKGTKVLFQIIKAIINQYIYVYVYSSHGDNGIHPSEPS